MRKALDLMTRVCNPCPLSLSVYGAVWECSISPGLRARAGDAVWASDSSSGGGEEERGTLRYPTPPPPHPAGNALPANHAAAGFPHHHPAISHPCRITLHQCVLVGTSRSMTINPSFTVAFSVIRTHHLHPFLLSSFAAHPLPSASFCS